MCVQVPGMADRAEDGDYRRQEWKRRLKDREKRPERQKRRDMRAGREGRQRKKAKIVGRGRIT